MLILQHLIRTTNPENFSSVGHLKISFLKGEDFSDATFVEQTDDFAQLHGIRGNLIWLGGDLPNHDYDGRKQYITFLFLQSRKINTNIFF